jgi:hypothetical protein
MKHIKASTALELLHIFWPDFVEVDGSIFLETVQPNNTSDLELGLDRTGMEAFYSHTHLIDLFKHNADIQPIDENDNRFIDYDDPDFLKLCDLGKALAQMWFQKLKLDFPKYDFRVYYTQEEDPIVRFHRIRQEEPNWIDEEHWSEKIDSGTVIIYDTRKNNPVSKYN